MKVLLDTHVWVWLRTQPERVREDVRAQLADERAELLLSAASSWEIAIKHALGKLPLPEPPHTYCREADDRHGRPTARTLQRPRDPRGLTARSAYGVAPNGTRQDAKIAIRFRDGRRRSCSPQLAAVPALRNDSCWPFRRRRPADLRKRSDQSLSLIHI